MIMSCYGRPHADTVRAVQGLAKAAARRFGVESTEKIESAWWRNCSTLLAERAANMVTKCSPTVPLPHALGGVDYESVCVVSPRMGRDDIEGVVVGADGPGGGLDCRP